MAEPTANPIKRYMNWLHTRWPVGSVELLSEVKADFSTDVPGVYVVGDLTGVPLLKFSADSGARAVKAIVADARFVEAQQGVHADALAELREDSA